MAELLQFMSKVYYYYYLLTFTLVDLGYFVNSSRVKNICICFRKFNVFKFSDAPYYVRGVSINQDVCVSVCLSVHVTFISHCFASRSNTALLCEAKQCCFSFENLYYCTKSQVRGLSLPSPPR